MNTQLSSTNVDTILGRTVVDMGLATPEEVNDCVQLRSHLAEEKNQRSLADLLVSSGIVTERQMRRVRREVEASRSEQQIPGYQILKKLGAGAMATVFQAKQMSLDRIVAIKVLPKRFTSDPQFVERFYAEGRAAAKLNHPNIVQAYDVGKAGDYHYFVMEYVEGDTVHDYLVKNGKYEEGEALRIIIQIAEALKHAHEKGFMHRDVKPKNIMLAPGGVAKLADMGLARSISDRELAEQEQGKAYGTPYYISPEQIRGEVSIDFRCDIYALGATFYHMVTGRVPFDGANPSAVMHKHLKQTLTPPDHVNPQLTTGVGEIIEVMMAKDRKNRYASTGDLLEDLKAVASGEPPMQARKRFEMSSLAGLEESGRAVETVEVVGAAPLTEQPVFWVALGSIALNIILIVVAIMLGSR
ncbi:MAG: serine/threonine-protein kinase [Phycisphaeraceae bacterium]